MELTPQSTRSPTSPFRYTSNPQPHYEYPSPAQTDTRFRSTESLQGLGLYSCSMTGSNAENSGSVSQVQSSTATNSWAMTALQHHDVPKSSESTPNILPAEYDSYTSFHPAASAPPRSHDIYPSQATEASTVTTATTLPSPVTSGNSSQRSSFSSAPASEIFTQAGSIHSYTPRIKMEDHLDFGSGNESMLMSSPQLNHSLLITSGNSYVPSLESFYPDPSTTMGWPKVEYTSSAQDLPSISSLPFPLYDRQSETQDRLSLSTSSGQGHQRRAPNTIARTRQPRKLTTKEEANFQCHIKGCGKLFGRSYNFKAHMETHDSSRDYPFPCTMKDCNKKFVRKTDLHRHHQSVHMKQRNHRCDYCSRFFARKDTLRRHMEDGCSKRFDIETVDFRPQNYSGSEQNTMRVISQPPNTENRQGVAASSTYSSSDHYSSPPRGLASQVAQDDYLTSASGTFMGRQDGYAGGENSNRKNGHSIAWHRG